jgi:hypothetical protein
MASSSRMQLARRRLQLARYSIGAVAITAFAAFGFVVRDAHPATHSSSSVASSTATATSDDSSSTFGGSASISPAPQTFAPQVQSSGS